MKTTLVSQFYEHLPKPDQRLFRILMHTGNREEELLMKELQRIRLNLEEKAFEDAAHDLEAIGVVYSAEDSARDAKGSRLHLPGVLRKNRQHKQLLLQLRDASVAEALRRLLKQLTTTNVFPGEDQFVLEALLYCYRRQDQATGDFPVADIRKLLMNPDKIVLQKPDERKDVLSLLLRAYFGEREIGSYLTGLFPGIINRESWINDFIDIHKSLYIHPLTNPQFTELEKVMLKICSNRKREWEYEPRNPNLPFPRFFKKEHKEDIDRLNKIIPVLGGDNKARADRIR